MKIQQIFVSLSLIVCIVAAVNVGNGTIDLCVDSPRFLDLNKCQFVGVTVVPRFAFSMAGSCNITSPSDVDILTRAIQFKVTYLLGSEQYSIQNTGVNIYDTNNNEIEDKYLPKDTDMKIDFTSYCRECTNVQNKKGYIIMELIFRNQPKRDGWCTIVETEKRKEK